MKLHWGNAIFIYFVIFIALAIAFIIFSYKQDIELVEKDYYKQGADYTRHINIQQRSEIYSDSILITEQESVIIVEATYAIKEMTDSLKVFFYNPSSKKKDYKVLLSPLSDSNYIDTKLVTKGRYTVKINWFCNNLEYEIRKDFFKQ